MSTVKKKLAIGLALMVVPIGVAACGGSSSGGSGDAGTINVVAYSTPQEAYENGLEPGFNKTADGKDVAFKNSFGASGDQSRAVEAGLPADVVEFSLETDMTRLVDAGVVADDWQDNQYNGMITDSVATIVVRPGNPDNIKDWDDLLKPGVEVLTPNPFTSGGARWNLMAVYGAEINRGKSEEEALGDLKTLLGNVPVQDASARDALQTFLSGKGDALISYENEAIQAQQAGEDVDYVTPDDTIKIENPIAVTKDAPAGDLAQKFVDYAYSDEGQQLLADKGYRPVVKSVFDKNKDKFPIPSGLFTIDSLGGWDKVATDFFDPDNGSVAAIEKELGVATQ
jgi:sulfate/thiosulfate-binding protein